MLTRHLLAPGIAALAVSSVSSQVMSGLDVLLEEQLASMRGKSLAIVCNQTSVTRHGEHIIDRLAAEEGITIRALFSPEHGIRGTADAGAAVQGSVEAEHGIPIYSLYDDSKAPQAEELAGVELILYDLQDAGARFYTKTSTLGYVLEAAGQHQIPIVVLDRPNPISGLHPEGPICESSQFSFVGRYPIPIRYALTPGELAQTMIGEAWIEHAGQIDLTVIPCRGWKRDMYYEQTGLPFIRPSPNMQSVEAAVTYTATCYFEGTNLSEGRGTDAPFLMVGAPFIDGQRWVSALASCELSGVDFEPVSFTPAPRPGASEPKRNGELCQGVRVRVTDREAFRPVRTGLAMLHTLALLWPRDFEIGTRANHFDRLWGTAMVRDHLAAVQRTGAGDWTEVANSWTAGVDQFWSRAAPYLMYE